MSCRNDIIFKAHLNIQDLQEECYSFYQDLSEIKKEYCTFNDSEIPSYNEICYKSDEEENGQDSGDEIEIEEMNETLKNLEELEKPCEDPFKFDNMNEVIDEYQSQVVPEDETLMENENKKNE